MFKKISCLAGMLILACSLASCNPSCETGPGLMDGMEVTYSNLERAKMYELAEFGINFALDEGINPYDSSQLNMYAFITDPAGQVYKVPMFYFQQYERHLSGEREYLDKVGNGEFRFRFTPRLDGEYKFFINCVMNGVQIRYPESGEDKFTVAPGTDDGFLQVADDRTHLEFDNGAPYVGIGHNLCGWEFAGVDNMAGTYEYERWMHELSFNGANMIQFDLSEGDNLEWTKIDNELEYSDDYNGLAYFNQKMAFKTDYKVNLADELGLFYRFTLFHWEDFDKESGNFPDWGWKRNPYCSENGGPAETASDFFTDEVAKKYTKNFIRYVVARWGYSPKLMLFELFNEVDAPDMAWATGRDFYQDNSAIVNWHKEMGEFIESLDIYNHIISTSCANYTNGGALWALDCFDISTFHRYTMYNEGSLVHETVKSLNNLVKSRVFSTDKPTIPGEFAVSPAGDRQRENDKEGVCFHNALYTTILSGGFGTAMSWTWGSYVDEYDLYDHYKPVNRLFEGADLVGSDTFDNLSNSQEINNIYYLGLKQEDRAWAWIKDSYHDYNKTSEGYTPIQISNGSFTIDGMKNGEYVLTFIDTYEDKVLSEVNAIATNGQLRVEYPSFYKDIAVKIIHKDSAYSMYQLGVNMKSSYMIQNSTSITLYGGGSGIAANTDSGIYGYKKISGDFTYTTRLDKFNYGGANASAGIMLRQDESSGSMMSFVGMENASTIVGISRDSFGGLASKSALEKQYELGVYLRVERLGSKITASVSSNNIDFVIVREDNIQFENEVLIGVMACNINTFGYAKAEFRNIKFGG